MPTTKTPNKATAAIKALTPTKKQVAAVKAAPAKKAAAKRTPAKPVAPVTAATDRGDGKPEGEGIIKGDKYELTVNGIKVNYLRRKNWTLSWMAYECTKGLGAGGAKLTVKELRDRLAKLTPPVMFPETSVWGPVDLGNGILVGCVIDDGKPTPAIEKAATGSTRRPAAPRTAMAAERNSLEAWIASDIEGRGPRPDTPLLDAADKEKQADIAARRTAPRKAVADPKPVAKKAPHKAPVISDEPDTDDAVTLVEGVDGTYDQAPTADDLLGN